MSDYTNRYWRNRDGSIIHTDDCIYSDSEGSEPWLWAQGKTQSDIRHRVRRVPWLRLCKRCWKGADDE